MCIKTLVDISIHVPTRGTTLIDKLWFIDNNFNPRAHEGHDVPHRAVRWIMVFQSTCPRGARPRAAMRSHELEISIHVPTRGTTSVPSVRDGVISFQSTCPRGARPVPRLRAPLWQGISIHVPTRGTTSHIITLIIIQNFNPRAHEGHDCLLSPGCCDATISIHVPTRGTTKLIVLD